ncbi:zinc finger protein 292 isoform X2 [Bombina bombina]|uniref:zinc finger protein 292 isoform X2 n=1 Tax=Bombina bombina TaxID=8345 RepID=UPI00235A872B|nr:zinc finger protein 292 isoform X2 [Bombina bombina]
MENISVCNSVDAFLISEGPLLLEMRIKRLLKLRKVASATFLAKLCSDHQEISKKGNFKQLYLTCLCAASPNIKLVEEIAKVDCKDALDMICNLESEGDEQTSLILCAAFLSRQLQFGEMYCAWELTLFWSKLQRRVDPSIQVYLERCRQLSLLTKTVYHIFFLIKVIQSETEVAGLPTCIELCVRALRLESSENSKVKISICKTISCLLPNDLEVKRACQLSEFLLEPTVDAYYAVEMLYNQPDQKYDEESLPVPNSLRCELLLVLKTRWPFDPEFWDWKTLKRQCLALMGEEASIVSSIDELNDNEVYEQTNDYQDSTKITPLNGIDWFEDTNNVHRDLQQGKPKKNRIKYMKEKGRVSERFRNWQAYMQYCVLCDKEFLGHRIVRHAQKHCKDGIYSCPICAKPYTCKDSFVPHVTLHVKESCKERLETMKPLRRLRKVPKKVATCKNKKAVTVSKQERPIRKNSMYLDDFIVFNDNDNSDDNDEKDNQFILPIEKQVCVNEFPCPIEFCTKRFKYFKNLIAHVKGHKDNIEATRFLEMQSKKVICQYCRRQFVSLTHLNDHLQMHCGVKPYICIQLKCKASFDTYADLLAHRKEHRVFRARCMFPKCGRIFSAAYMLFDHEAQHYYTFTCKHVGCGKIYHSHIELEKHLNEHGHQNTLQESNSTTNAELTVPNIPAKFSDITIKKETLYEEHPVTNNDFSTIPSNSADVNEPIVAKDLQLPQTKLMPKEVSLAPDGLNQTSSLLDHLSPPVEVLPSPNILNTALPSSSDLINQVLPPIGSVLSSTNSSDSIKIPSHDGEFNDSLIHPQSLIARSNENELTKTHGSKQPGVQEQCLPDFQEPKINPGDLSKKNIDCTNSDNLKAEANNVISLNLQGQQAALCENSLVSGFGGGGKSETVLPLPLETSMLSNVLPTVSPSAPPIPPQRFKCNVEGCTRIYNSIQSIGKHMKTTHPEHYDDFKMERKNRKKQLRSGTPGRTAADVKLPYCILPGVDNTTKSAFPSQLQNGGNPSFSNQLQHLSSSEDGSTSTVFSSQVQNGSDSSFSNPLQHLSSPSFPTHLENLVNPILNSVESIITQGLSKNVSESLLVSETGSLTNSTLTTQLEDLAKVVLPMKFENGSDPFLPLPTENDPLPVMSSLTGGTVFSQLESNTSHEHVLASETASSVFLKEEPDTANSFIKQEDNTDVDTNFNLEKSASILLNSNDQKVNTGQTSKTRDRKTKHSKRPKCPAIIRDGKFICSRCFRVFTNPRSLGGHLSKRAICKPHNEYDISHDIPQRDGQSSVLASMILSASPQQNNQPPKQTFHPETNLTNQPFVNAISTDNPTSLLQSEFTQSNFTSENKVKSPQGPQIKGVVEHKAAPVSVTSDNCVPNNFQISTDSITDSISASNVVMSHIVQTGSFKEDNSKMTDNCNDISAFSNIDFLNTAENGLPSDVLNSVAENITPIPLNSKRVSVISCPQNSTPKKKNGSSKKKKKVLDLPHRRNPSHELAKNLLAAVGNLPTSIGGDMQISTELQPSLDNYGSDFLKNIAKHLNSTDKQIFPPYINESHVNPEVSALPPLNVKTEKCESMIQPSYTPERKEPSDLDVRSDFTRRPFEDLSPEAIDVFSVSSNIQNACASSPQSQITVNGNIDMPGDLRNTISPSSVHHSCIVSNIPICSVSPTQETDTKLDAQILEIMELVQKLQLLDNGFSENLDSNPVSECPLVSSLPQTSSVIVPNPSLNVLAQQTDDDTPLIDKSNKPFICQEMECTYCAMTKDALFKHYSKVHCYTKEKILEIKKHQLKFAPFKCVVPTCTKTFTRNSNLRAHCQTTHRFTAEQMIRLKIKRPYEKKAVNDGIASPTHETSNKAPEMVNCCALGMTSQTPDSQAISKQSDTDQDKLTLEAIELSKVEESITSVIMSSQTSHLSFSKKNRRGPKVRIRIRDKEMVQKKPREKDLKNSQGINSFKPYKCVHQGCTAAFTIQQNLILHYQAVHKSDLCKFSLGDEEKGNKLNPNEGQNAEFRCMETDCSRIFQEVTSLIQHYMKLHEMIAEEIENALAVQHIENFKCDQYPCTFVFTNCSAYIGHLEETHDLKMKRVRMDGDEMYKCDIGDCDRVYATRSNLLRHIFRKHNEKHNEHLIRPRKLSLSDQDSLDDRTLNEKPKVFKHKADGDVCIDLSKTKRKKVIRTEKDLKSEPGQNKLNPLTLKYCRHTYSLKTKDDALSECLDDPARQYPCMVRGCSSIVTSEHNIIRHYKCHKLSRAFILKHSKALIVCKSRGRSKAHTVSSTFEPTENPKTIVNEPPTPLLKDPSPGLIDSSDESTISTSQQSENEKDEMDELAELFIAKLSNEDSTGSDSQARTPSFVSSDLQDAGSCPSEPPREKSNTRTIKQRISLVNKKRKIDTSDEMSAETCSTLSGEETIPGLHTTEDPPAFDLSSFKPMGFEVSFLKFLEESAAKQKKSVEINYCKSKDKTLLQASERDSPVSLDDVDSWEDTNTYLVFDNRSQLPNLDNVKVVLDQTFNNYIDLVVKQLHDLKPTVVLKHICWEELYRIANEQSLDTEGVTTV